ncbi:MAG TPA: hypothetical protein VLR93_06935 [Patescibacteria group bacterium]|nr:hypothetical protein [Patescibacteria group bacterium]
MADADGAADPDGRGDDGDPTGDGLAEPTGEPDGDAALDADGDGLAEATGEPDAAGEPDGDGPAEGGALACDGAGVEWSGLGTKTMTAASTAEAVTTPASSPTTTARRGDMAGGYQYEAPEAA